jgi:N-acetylneuraminic acid mutarotase
MSYRLLLPRLLTLGAIGVVACGEQTTQPNTAVDQPSAPQLAVASNTWLTRRDMPLELFEQAAAVVPNAAGQSILYAIGGGKVESSLPGAPVPMGEVRAYNVATNTWTSKRDMPVARWGLNGAGVIGGKIYVTGGYTKEGYRGVTASLFVYNVASNTWTRKRDMPAAGGDGITGVIGGKLYVVSFNSAASYPPVMNFFRYNPTANSWTRLPNPTDYPNLNVSGGVIDNKLYLMGHTGEESRLLEYNPITNQWTKKRSWSKPSCLPGLPCYIEGPTVVMLAHLYVFGRAWNFDGRWTPGIFIYDPVSNIWADKPLLTTFSYWDEARLTAARVFLNGQPRVEVIGGYRPGNSQQYIP